MHGGYLIVGSGGGGVGRVRTEVLDALQDSTSPDWTSISHSNGCMFSGGLASPSEHSQNRPY